MCVGTIPKTFYFLETWYQGENCTFQKGTTLVPL